MRLTTVQTDPLPPFDVPAVVARFREAAASSAAIGLRFDAQEAAVRVFAPHHVEPALERLRWHGLAQALPLVADGGVSRG